MNPQSLHRVFLSVLLVAGLCACGQAASEREETAAPLARVAPPAGQAWANVVTVTPEGGYRMGNPQAPIKLVEYGSLTCPHCADFEARSRTELRDNFIASGRVRFEFRNFIRDAIDLTAVQITRCGPPETYFPLTEQIFANQRAFFDTAQAAGKAAQDAAFGQPDGARGPAIGKLTGLTDFAGKHGLPPAQAEQCLADTAKAQALANLVSKQSSRLGITGTPTFLLNDRKLEENSWDQIKPLLASAGAR